MKLRPIETLVLLCVLLGMGGCANQQPIRDFEVGKKKLSEGQLEEGLAKIELAAKADPENVEYRQYLFKQRELVLNHLLSRAESERVGEAFDEAVLDYKRVLTIDPIAHARPTKFTF